MSCIIHIMGLKEIFILIMMFIIIKSAICQNNVAWLKFYGVRS